MSTSLKRMATMHRMQTTGLSLFYAKGYNNTSIDDILKELSLSKGAFYYHFSSKADFFLQIIDNLIVRKVYSQLIEPIEGHNNPIEKIINCFDNALETAVHNELDYGFLLSNFITEFKGNNDLILKHLTDVLNVWEVSLVTALQKGKYNEYIDRHVDCEGVATYLISSYIGIRTLMTDIAPSARKYKYMTQLKSYFKSIEAKRAIA